MQLRFRQHLRWTALPSSIVCRVSIKCEKDWNVPANISPTGCRRAMAAAGIAGRGAQGSGAVGLRPLGTAAPHQVFCSELMLFAMSDDGSLTLSNMSRASGRAPTENRAVRYGSQTDRKST